MADWLRLRRLAEKPFSRGGYEAIYANADGDLKHVAVDGTESDLGGGGEAGSGPLLVVTAHIPSATLLTLTGANSYELLAAPGQGKVIFPLHFFALATGTTPYTVGPTLTAVVGTDLSQNGPYLAQIGDVLVNAPGPYWETVGAAGQNFGVLADAEDLPLILKASSGSFVDGDLDLDLTLYYVIVEVP